MNFFLSIFLPISLFASFNNLTSFDADFVQTITDEKNKELVYEVHIKALKPQNALWEYTKPIDKSVYINSFNVIIVEPEIEQAIIKRLKTSFDFFNMIKAAKKTSDNQYTTLYGDTIFTIRTDNKKILSISYIDEFENNVKIIFKNQTNNLPIKKVTFFPNLPAEYDIIRD